MRIIFPFGPNTPTACFNILTEHCWKRKVSVPLCNITTLIDENVNPRGNSGILETHAQCLWVATAPADKKEFVPIEKRFKAFE